MAGASLVRADEQLGAWKVVDGVDNAIYLTGDITLNTPLDFSRALQMRPNAKTLFLSSSGGLVSSGLIVAEDVSRRHLSTFIPANATCAAACSYIFLAGADRQADGSLSVRAIASNVADSGDKQLSISNVLDMLVTFDVPPAVISTMLRSSPEDHVYTPAEAQQLGINRSVTVAAVTSGPMTGGQPRLTPGAGGPPHVDLPSDEPSAEPSSAPDVAPQADQLPSISPPAVVKPKNQDGHGYVAVYQGVDFYGDDIPGGMGNASNLVECTRACLGDNSCHAFTFNTNPKYSSGRNCFLKAGPGRYELYAQTLSGILVGDPSDAQTLTFSGIDPTNDMEVGINYLGDSIGDGPLSTAHTLDACRVACLEDSQCKAFSYKSSTSQCWLKSDAGQSVAAKGYSSGLKRPVSIAPIDVVPLPN